MNVFAVIGFAVVYLLVVSIIASIVWSFFMTIIHGYKEVWYFWLWMVHGGWKV